MIAAFTVKHAVVVGVGCVVGGAGFGAWLGRFFGLVAARDPSACGNIGGAVGGLIGGFVFAFLLGDMLET